MANPQGGKSTKDRVEDMASTAASKAQDVAANVSHKASEFASAAAERTESGLSSVGSGMQNLAGTVRENLPREGYVGKAAGTVASGLEQGGQYLQEHGLRDIGDDLTGVIKTYPVAALLVAFGVGLLAGMAARR